jgi:hypothetical protein
MVKEILLALIKKENDLLVQLGSKNMITCFYL